ncbi:MAG: peroxide stress protein YaaA [Acetatifactor sp.]|nr:peroxide stress protein YaaA [Acetatifactor sp.]
MKIILSPAKKMNVDLDSLDYLDLPEYLQQAEEIMCWLKSKSHEELKKLWGCNDKIAEQNFERLDHMELRKRLTPAILSYEGIAYQYMAPAVFEQRQLDFVQEHLRILSAFYGVLKPMDGVTPYRLEMQAKASINGHKDLYDLWGRRLYDSVRDDDGVIINLASKEYSKCVEKYLTDRDTYITVTFCEKSGDKLVTKGTYAKMARGEMVRYMAEMQIEKPVKIKNFDRLGYVYRGELSTESEYVFERVTDSRLSIKTGNR